MEGRNIMVSKKYLLALAGIVASGATHAQTTQAPDKNTTKTETVKENAQGKTVETKFGSLSYNFGENGLEYKGALSGLKATQLLPNMYDEVDGSISCGPLSSYDEGALLNNAERQLRRVVAEEIIAQDLQQKTGRLSKEEKSFLEQHQEDMTKWGLETKETKEGITISQKDPMSGGKVIVNLKANGNENSLNFGNYMQKSR